MCHSDPGDRCQLVGDFVRLSLSLSRWAYIFLHHIRSQIVTCTQSLWRVQVEARPVEIAVIGHAFANDIDNIILLST